VFRLGAGERPATRSLEFSDVPLPKDYLARSLAHSEVEVEVDVEEEEEEEEQDFSRK